MIVWISACFVAAFIDGKVSPHAPQPYASAFAAAFATFFLATLFLFPFAAFLVGAFLGFSAFAFFDLRSPSRLKSNRAVILTARAIVNGQL